MITPTARFQPHSACDAAGMAVHHYRLVIDGELSQRYARAFEGMEVRSGHGETELTGEIVDPSQLQGLLERIAGLGLTLKSVSPLDSDPASPGRSGS